MCMPSIELRRKIAAVAVLITAACSGGADTDATTDTSQGASAPAPRSASATDAPFEFTAADLDAYERGLRKEIELVLAAKARGDSAKTPAERGAASQAAFETTTAPAAAQAIGASVERYEATRRTVGRVLQTLDFQGKIAGPTELDTANATAEMKQRLTSDPFAELAPASAELLRARLEPLSKVWIEYMTLVAVAG
jgi:hypothetical protein